MFGSKKKAERERLLKEQKEAVRKEKEIEAKINIKKTLAAMKSQSSKLEKFKQEYITKAKTAMSSGDAQTYKLAKSGLKICMSKQKVIDAMIANFEISMQLNDMNKVIGEFVGGMNLISEQMKDITSGIDMVKAQTAYEKAVANNEGQYQALDAFLETAAESIQSFEGLDSNISDEEVERLIVKETTEPAGDIDEEIDKKINELKAKLQS